MVKQETWFCHPKRNVINSSNLQNIYIGSNYDLIIIIYYQLNLYWANPNRVGYQERNPTRLGFAFMRFVTQIIINTKIPISLQRSPALRSSLCIPWLARLVADWRSVPKRYCNKIWKNHYIPTIIAKRVSQVMFKHWCCSVVFCHYGTWHPYITKFMF